MVMRTNTPYYNFALGLPEDKRTGTCIVSTHFEERDHILYDYGKRLTYLHYIGIPAMAFQRLCKGDNLDFPYRDIFLYYRYLREGGKYPKFRGKRRPHYEPANRFIGFLRRIEAFAFRTKYDLWDKRFEYGRLKEEAR